MRKHKRGFTLTEVAIVLSIIGVVMSGIWVAAGMVSANSKVQKSSAQIASIAGNARALFAAHGLDNASPYSNTDVTCMVAQNGLLPAEMGGQSCVTSNYATYPKNVWNGYVEVWTQSAINSVIITYHGLSQSACARLATIVFGNKDMTSQAIYNGLTATYNNYPMPPYGGNAPMTPAQINSFCGNSSGNYVQASYAIR